MWASDPEGSALTFSLVSGPSNGTLAENFPSFVYQPTEGFVGTDSLTFRVNDGESNSNAQNSRARSRK